MTIVTTQQMRDLEFKSENEGVSQDTLMENAGLAVAKTIRGQFDSIVDMKILVLVGPGNNGGDGLVMAKHLHLWGADISIYLCKRNKIPDEKLEIIKHHWIDVTSLNEDKELKQFKQLVNSANLVVDCVLGTGLGPSITGDLKDIFNYLGKIKTTKHHPKLIALDIPTGVNANTGAIDPVCVKTDITITLGYYKLGLFCPPATEKVGQIILVDIGIPPYLSKTIKLKLLVEDWARNNFPHRLTIANKGTFGKALIVAGSINFIGAAYLAASSASRIGTGLVTLAIPKSIQASLASKLAEVTYLPLSETKPGSISGRGQESFIKSIPNYNALLIGCGLGQSNGVRQFIEDIILDKRDLPPLVLDADALNILSLIPEWWTKIQSKTILTPHPGEMARLLGKSILDIQQSRLAIAQETAKNWNKFIVLKGAYTIIASPDGEAIISPFANPGLASAGTGDILAGIIVGLLAQGFEPMIAAAMGVYLHGTAGENIRHKLGDTGMIASDLLPILPQIINQLKETK